MTLLGALVRSTLNDPTMPISSASIVEWAWGTGSRSSAGVIVNERSVYGLTAYYRGVALLSSTMAALPLKVFKEGTRDRILRRTVLDRPNPGQTPFEFWQGTYANAITWGTGYARKYRDRGGVVQEMWPIHPSSVHQRRVKPSKTIPDGRLYDVTDMDGSQAELTSSEVFAMPYLSVHGGEGLRPLQLANQVLGINIAAEKTAAVFYGKGTMPSGILRAKDKLNKEQRGEWRKSWHEKLGGPDNAGEIAIIDNGGEFQPISIPPADAQLLQSRQFGVEEVARLLGVPTFLLMDNEKNTSWGTGIEQQMIGLVQFTLNGWYTLGEQRITADIFPGFTEFAEYSVQALLRGDSAARAAFYHSLRNDAILTGNEIRAFETLGPIEGGDELLLPAGVLPQGVAEELARVNAVAALIRAGFEPEAACIAVGIDPIAHTGLVPTTITIDPTTVAGGPNAQAAA